MSTVTRQHSAARQELTGFGGRLIGPEDADYDEARKVYNAMIDKRPALIAQCASPADVARTVGFARDHDLLLAVRGGGHNGAGLGTCDDGVVIDLSPLKDVDVDPQARTVRVGGGCTWGEVDRATNEHGLATPSGIISTTGVGGLTLGGGIGHLTRKCGLTIDNLLEAELVLASGERVRASADENPDLYWAIRGGGGNFGVVTSFLFRLHEVGTVVAGPTFWPVEQRRRGALGLPRVPPGSATRAERLLRLPHRAAGAALPRGDPPAQGVRCRLVLRRLGGGGRRAMAPLLESLPEPLMHGVAPMPHSALQGAFDGLYPPGDQWYWRADFVKEIPDEAVQIHAQFGAEMPTMKSTMHMYPIDGAAHDVGPSDTAWSYRDATVGLGLRGRRSRPGKRGRHPAAGASTTSRRCTRTPPAVPT